MHSALDWQGVFVEALMPEARRVEIQIIGDGHTLPSLDERECTLLRRHHKLVDSW